VIGAGERTCDRRRGLAAPVLLTLVVALSGCGVGASGAKRPRGPDRQRFDVSRARAVHPAPGQRRLGLTDPATQIDFSVVLRLPGHVRLQRFLNGLRDPRSKSFRHYITPTQFGARFGISNADLRALTEALGRDGVAVIRRYPQRTALEVRAPAQVVNRLFGISLTDYVDSHGHRYHAPQNTPTVPAGLRSVVSGVAGLDSEPSFRPADVPVNGLTPHEAAVAYDLAPLGAMGIQGQGQKIAVVSLDSFNPSDLAAFKSQFGLTGPAPQVIPIAGGAGGPGGMQQEVDLDLDVLTSIAPQAQILDYEAPNGGPVTWGQIVDRIVADHQADIVSDSWGICEFAPRTRSEYQRDEQSIAAADAAGVSIFAASGDSGAYDCTEKGNNPTDLRLSVEYPASSAGVVAVGGTSLSVGQDGSYLKENGWEDVLSRAGSGGGLSALFARPSWQSAPGVQNRFSNGMRQLPDVSAAADVASPWPVVAQGQLGSAGGTSAAAPFWAASMVLVRQFAAQQNAGRLGFVAPMLYAIASSPQPAPPFHDITAGGNLFYQATPGWDFVTGLGSPDVNNLAQDVVAYLQQHPQH
jgi:kumamolisin